MRDYSTPAPESPLPKDRFARARAIIKRHGLTPTQQVVLHRMVEAAGRGDGHGPGRSFLSQVTIAEDCNLSRNTVHLTQRVLERLKIITPEGRQGQGHVMVHRLNYGVSFTPIVELANAPRAPRATDFNGVSARSTGSEPVVSARSTGTESGVSARSTGTESNKVSARSTGTNTVRGEKKEGKTGKVAGNITECPKNSPVPAPTVADPTEDVRTAARVSEYDAEQATIAYRQGLLAKSNAARLKAKAERETFRD